MTQEIIHNAGQVTKDGNIIVCQGASACPLERDEAERQKRFEANTGIACCKGARIALTRLLEDGHFDVRQLALAWRNGAIYWDRDAEQLRARESRLEKAYGFGVVILFGLLTLAFVLAFIIERPALTLLQITQFVLVAGTFFAAVPVAEKYMIRPNRIASRAKPILQSHYTA